MRSSTSYISPLSVYADEKLIYSDQILANGSASIKISNSSWTGNHILRAEIAQDMQPINDVYQKSIYVVPKPEVLLLSSGDSPLAQNLDDLYKLTVVSELPKELQDYKSIVIDDIEYTTSLDRLKDYVREGGGLIVVGGKDSYDLGEYRNTSLEGYFLCVPSPAASRRQDAHLRPGHLLQPHVHTHQRRNDAARL